MAAQIPTLNDLYTSILTQLEAELGADIPAFGRIFLRAIAAVQAAKIKLYYLALANVQKNIFADTAESENIGGTLERFGRVKLGRNPFAATQGEYNVTVTGTPTSTVSGGQTFKGDDNSSAPGKLYILELDFSLVTDPDTMVLKALEGGTDSALINGDTLTATSPISGVNSLVTITSEVTAALEAEDLEDYREKVVQAYQTEPQGGAGSDYRIWASDAQGVLRVYPYFKSGEVNEIDLFVEATVADSTDGKGTPSGAILTEVEAVVEFDPDTTKDLNLRGRRPLTVNQIHYTAITPLDIDIVIFNLLDPSGGVDAAIDAALETDISEIRPYVPTVDIEANRNDFLTINKLIATIQSIIDASNNFDSVTLEVDGVPVPISYQFTGGDIPYVNSITYS